MKRARVAGAGLALAAALAMSGCGDDTSGDGSGGADPAVTADDLEGTTYMSTSVTGQDLVAGSSVVVAFEDGVMAVSAGCNTMTSAYAVTGGTLAWSGEPASTMMGCADDLMAQDQWLSRSFSDGFDAALDGDTLTLTASEISMELEPRQ